MTDFIIVPRAPSFAQIRRAALSLYNREPTENEFAILHRAYQDMTSDLPDFGLVITEQQFDTRRLIDPDSLLHALSE